MVAHLRLRIILVGRVINPFQFGVRKKENVLIYINKKTMV